MRGSKSWNGFRRRREISAHAADARQVEPTPGEMYQTPCVGDCDCLSCDPDGYDREAIRRRMIVESPGFTLAERVLAQVGITIKICPAIFPAGTRVRANQGASR
jgi:hypothetical protein